MESGRLDAKSQIYGSFRCFSFVSSSTFPPSSISCGDLSFPAGPMLISYWSSGLRVGVCEMGKGEHCGGIWVQAKNNLHLHFSQLLCADFIKCEHARRGVFFFLTHSTITHTSTPGRGHSTTTVLYQSQTCCFQAAGRVSCSRASQQSQWRFFQEAGLSSSWKYNNGISLLTYVNAFYLSQTVL